MQRGKSSVLVVALSLLCSSASAANGANGSCQFASIDTLLGKNVHVRTEWVAAIQAARAKRMAGKVALQHNDVDRAIELEEEALTIYGKLGIGEKSVSWGPPAVLEFAQCLREAGNASIRAGRVEGAVVDWGRADNLYINRGIINAFTSSILRAHPEIVDNPECIAVERVTAANMSLFELPLCGDLANESHNAPVRKEKHSPLFLFPCNSCYVYEVKKASATKPDCWWKAAEIEVETVQKRMLRDDYWNDRGDSHATGLFHVPLKETILLPPEALDKLPGQLVVWSDAGWSIQAPFPYQCFDEQDIAALKQELADDRKAAHGLLSDMQRYLEQRWTAARLIDFCRPETRLVGWRNPLIPHQWFRSAVTESQLQREAAGLVGDARWYCESSQVGDGPLRPCRYSVDVQRGADSWNVEVAFAHLRDWSDEDFIKHRLLVTLRTCLDAYRMAADTGTKFVQTETDLEDDVIHRTLSLDNVHDERLLRGDQNEIYQFTCTLGDSRKLCAVLDEKLTIKSIYLDGKPDLIWNKAYEQVNSNIELARARKQF
jgi:hypothetical protein